MTPTREALLEAINDLIHDPDPRVKKSALDSVISVGKNYPVRLTGDMRVLNPLVDLALADPDAWEAVKKLIDDELDSKEAQVRAELLKPPHQRRKI